ncbi:MAG: HAD family hydrolase [Alphaproteobacteria bacterium]|nr:HAD family hydrolase [Alphaproteobacteria bacterium]
MAAIQDCKTVLFDLDGTLTDPKEGITKSLVYALERLGRAAPAPEALTACIGPPLRQNFMNLLQTDDPDLVEQAVRIYRRRYIAEEKGVTENKPYPAIPDVLGRLWQGGRRLMVVTSKPTAISEKIVRHFSMHGFFAKVYGAELDGTRGDKGELIAYVLEEEKLSPQETVMIGDRKFDILGAKKNGVKGVGVCWGYGSREELTEAGATVLAGEPEDLLRLLTV